MNMRTASKTMLPLVLALASAWATAKCEPVSGTVKLKVDEACRITTLAPGPVYTGECYSVRLSLSGFPAGKGYAGVTSEPIIGPLGVAFVPGAATPAAILQDAPPFLPRQILQTARSVITLGGGPRSTTLYGSDVVIVQPTFDQFGQVTGAAAVTEQIIITGTDEKGAYADATGYLTISGDSRGQNARVLGEICR